MISRYFYVGIVAYTTRGCVTASDIIVLAVTVKNTLRTWRDARRFNQPMSVTTCLLRDGEWHDITLPTSLADSNREGSVYFLYE